MAFTVIYDSTVGLTMARLRKGNGTWAMTHIIVRLTAERQKLKQAFQSGEDAERTVETSDQTCKIPADEIMLGILHRLITSGRETPDGRD